MTSHAHSGSTHPYRPTPNPKDGALTVDPDILLKAKGLDLDISFFYSTRADNNGPFGYRRSASVNGYVASATNAAQIVRGDLSLEYFSKSGSTYTAQSENGISSTLTYSGSSFIETRPDGIQIIYTSTGKFTGVYEIDRVVTPRGWPTPTPTDRARSLGCSRASKFLAAAGPRSPTSLARRPHS